VTKSLATHLGHEFDGGSLDSHSAEALGELLERVRHNAVGMVADLPHLPTALRVRAGEVSLEVEWAASGTGEVATVEPPVAVARPAHAEPAVRTLNSPAVGVFYQASGPGVAPFVAVGDTVAVGIQIGIVETMKLMIPIEADQAGVVAEILKADGESVEFAEPLFALGPA
jgi:acetyl-CoA carboxylase biotin carboxyl carrier protein